MEPAVSESSMFVAQYTARGCVYLPADTPVCAVDNICFQDGLVEFHVAPFQGKRWPWNLENDHTSHDQTSLGAAWQFFTQRCCRSRGGFDTIRACVEAERLGFSCCRQRYQTKNEPRLLTDPALFTQNAVVLETAVNDFQFGHSTSKIFQFASLALWASSRSPLTTSFCQKPSFSLGLFSQISQRKIPATVREWLEIVAGLQATKMAAGSNPVRFETLDDVIIDTKFPSCHLTGSCPRPRSPGRVCVRKAFFINDYEQYYFRQADADQLNDAVDQKLNLLRCPHNSTKRRGMMLLRSEGSGGRNLVNALEVQELVYRVFQTQLQNVTINSAMDARQQATEFRKYGLIISPHSSQLKHLAIACPCTIVVEINAMDGTRDPFSVGVQHRNIVYVQSANHTPEAYGRPIDLGPDKALQFRALRGLDIFVNMTKLRIDMQQAVQRHRSNGCQVF